MRISACSSDAQVYLRLISPGSQVSPGEPGALLGAVFSSAPRPAYLSPGPPFQPPAGVLCPLRWVGTEEPDIGPQIPRLSENSEVLNSA